MSAHDPSKTTATPSSSATTTTRRHLPHWTKDGAIYWITFRLADAIPQDKLRAWQEERSLWLERHPEPWNEADWNAYDQRFGAQIEAWLDAGMGSRALARPDAREVVKNSLLRFDGDRLRLHAAVIMPTHVHLLLEPLGGHDLSRILKGIKGASARDINKRSGVTGTFWLDESYDRIVRSEEEYRRLIRYVADNPVKAGLQPDEYWHYQGGTNGQTGTSVPPLGERLDRLISHLHEPPNFTAAETRALVRAISEIRVLDPAVGSGAFPMGVLHKLTLALKRLDPRNEHWEALQKERATERAAAAFDAPSQQEREDELAEISETFERYRDSDFGRKLYLMQNSIFGVDVQPVACQIAKLRFFISLAIEQQPNDDPVDNYGIKPLPNLETRFIAADTLIGLQLSEAGPLLRDDAVQQMRKDIEAIRERYFLANNRGQKLRLSHREATQRKQLERVLEDLGAEWAARQQREIEQKVALLRTPEQRRRLREAEEKQYRIRQQALDAGLEDARKIAHWDPYDQNAKADWFDAEHMFGVDGGFDVVIGNPPYVRADSGARHLEMRQRIENSRQYETLWEKWDLYVPFIERGYKLLADGGFSTMIVSDAYCHARYARKSQDFFLNNSRIICLDFLGKIRIFEASVHNVVCLLQKGDGKSNKPRRQVHYPEFGTVSLLSTDEQRNLTHRVFFPEDVISQEFSIPTVQLKDICYISYGLRPSNKPDTKEKFITADLISVVQSTIHSKPFVEGKHLDYWLPATNLWIEWGTERAPSKFYAPTFEEMYQVAEKILVQRSPGPDPKACYDDQHLIYTPSSVGFIPWHSLAGVRNRSIKKQTRYRDEKPQRPDLPQREELEKTSRRFAVKFLLGVMNSTAARDFLRANRRSNIHLYPDDWKKLPIPDVTPDRQAPVVDLVDQVLAAKRSNPKTDTDGLEAAIDRLVHELYGLTDA